MSTLSGTDHYHVHLCESEWFSGAGLPLRSQDPYNPLPAPEERHHAQSGHHPIQCDHWPWLQLLSRYSIIYDLCLQYISIIVNIINQQQLFNSSILINLCLPYSKYGLALSELPLEVKNIDWNIQYDGEVILEQKHKVSLALWVQIFGFIALHWCYSSICESHSNIFHLKIKLQISYI